MPLDGEWSRTLWRQLLLLLKIPQIPGPVSSQWPSHLGLHCPLQVCNKRRDFVQARGTLASLSGVLSIRLAPAQLLPQALLCRGYLKAESTLFWESVFSECLAGSDV